MISDRDIDDVVGQGVYDQDGQEIGRAGQVYLDDQTGQPEWLTVRSGLFGTSEAFVPVSGAQWAHGRVTVHYPAQRVLDAPDVDSSSGHLDPASKQQLLQYWRGDDEESGRSATDATGIPEAAHRVVGDDAVVRSEERLRVGTRRYATTRVRVVKRVVTEEQTVTVQVRREVLSIEREPVRGDERDTDRAGSAGRDSARAAPGVIEVVLREERPVVSLQVVPVERVRVVVEQVTGRQQVSETVRKEQIETEFVRPDGPDRR